MNEIASSISATRTFSPTALNEPEAAHYVGMSRSFLRKARTEGAPGDRTPGPPFVKIGRSVRYLVPDLENWLIAHRHEKPIT